MPPQISQALSDAAASVVVVRCGDHGSRAVITNHHAPGLLDGGPKRVRTLSSGSLDMVAAMAWWMTDDWTRRTT
jgi:hypothetical protein